MSTLSLRAPSTDSSKHRTRLRVSQGPFGRALKRRPSRPLFPRVVGDPPPDDGLLGRAIRPCSGFDRRTLTLRETRMAGLAPRFVADSQTLPEYMENRLSVIFQLLLALLCISALFCDPLNSRLLSLLRRPVGRLNTELLGV